MPTQHPIVLLLFFSIAARFEVLTNPEPAQQANPSTRSMTGWAWVAGILLAIGYTGAHVVLARGSLKPIERAARTNRDYVTGTYPTERQPDGTFRWTRKHATFALRAASRYLVLSYHVEHPDAGTHPVKVRITTPCQTVVDEFRSDMSIDGRGLEIPEGQDRVVFDTDVSRTWKPSDAGQADTRDLGLAIRADFIATPGVVASQEWIPLTSCPR
jgi:hypothetical protein